MKVNISGQSSFYFFEVWDRRLLTQEKERKRKKDNFRKIIQCVIRKKYS